MYLDQSGTREPGLHGIGTRASHRTFQSEQGPRGKQSLALRGFTPLSVGDGDPALNARLKQWAPLFGPAAFPVALDHVMVSPPSRHQPPSTTHTLFPRSLLFPSSQLPKSSTTNLQRHLILTSPAVRGTRAAVASLDDPVFATPKASSLLLRLDRPCVGRHKLRGLGRDSA